MNENQSIYPGSTYIADDPIILRARADVMTLTLSRILNELHYHMPEEQKSEVFYPGCINYDLRAD